jgi:hypothetical protein
MSLNMTNAMDKKKVRRFGKLFGTIDFQMNEKLSSEAVKQRTAETTVGEFQIDGKSYPVTLAEIDRIIETAQMAKSVFFKSYSMGRYGY